MGFFENEKKKKKLGENPVKEVLVIENGSWYSEF